MLETACLTEHTAEGNTAEGETVDLDGEQTNLGAAGPANSVVEYTVVDLEAEAAGMAALFGAASTVESRTPSLAALSWAQTDYSELLPPLSFDEEIPLTENMMWRVLFNQRGKVCRPTIFSCRGKQIFGTHFWTLMYLLWT